MASNPILILDIQSSSVRGSLVSGKTILFELGIEIPNRVTKDSRSLTENILSATKLIVEGVLKDLILHNSKAKISVVHCVVSSPWLISQAQAVSTVFAKNTKITEKLVNNLIANEKARPTLHITEEAYRSGQLKIIEKKVFSILLNGYPTQDWQGKSAAKLEVSFVVSSASKSFITDLENICRNIVSIDKIVFHSSLILHYISSRELIPDAAAHVCVHVHNEITDIVSINNLGAIYFASYPVGLNTITHRIAAALGVKKHTAESMLSLYAEMHVDPSHNRNSGVIIEKILQSWSREYHEFIKLAEIPHAAPVHVFVSSEKYPKLLTRLLRIPSSKAKIELITENIYIEAINSLA